MLYEVITRVGPQAGEAFAARAAAEEGGAPEDRAADERWRLLLLLTDARRWRVITSYSIHYTKLYDVGCGIYDVACADEFGMAVHIPDAARGCPGGRRRVKQQDPDLGRG